MSGKTRGFKTIILELLTQDRKYFTLNQIVRETGLQRQSVRDVLIELTIDDYLMRVRKRNDPYEKAKGPPLQNVTYRVRKPRNLAQKIVPKFRGENTAMDRIWFVIRGLREFTRRDLLHLTSDMKGQPVMSKETVRWYTKMLARAGIIASDGRTGNWRLVKDVGPRRPYVGGQKAEDRKQ